MGHFATLFCACVHWILSSNENLGYCIARHLATTKFKSAKIPYSCIRMAIPYWTAKF